VPGYEIFEPVLLYQIKGEIKPFVADGLLPVSGQERAFCAVKMRLDRIRAFPYQRGYRGSFLESFMLLKGEDCR
jgi:hypothetical protein